MGKPGPKRLSAATLQARGSPLAVQRAREERQSQGLTPRIVPVVYPLPRTLSKQARQWGTTLMAAAFFDVTEFYLLVETLEIWDRTQQLKRFVQVHGCSQVDKAGVSRQRPEARMLDHSLQLLLSYTRRLEISEAR